MRYPVETFSPEERALLAPHFTNLDRPVFGLVNLIDEFGLYAYPDNPRVETDKPVKEHDHGMDMLKYMVLGTCYFVLLGFGVAATVLASLVWG